MRGFEGGQMPLHRRLPKRGFTNIFRKEFAIVNLGTLDRMEGGSFDPGKMLELGLITKIKDGLKVLGSGELKRAIHIKAHLFSQSALDKIKAAGGTAEVIPGVKRAETKVPPPVRIRTPKPAAPKDVETPQADAPEAGAAGKEEKKSKKGAADKGAEKTSKPKQAKPSGKTSNKEEK
jgi:hypothetical protein